MFWVGELPCTCELKLWARAQLSFPNHAAGWWGCGAAILGYFYRLSVMEREVSLFSLLVITFEVSEGQLIKHNSTVEMLLRKSNFVTLDRPLLTQVLCLHLLRKPGLSAPLNLLRKNLCVQTLYLILCSILLYFLALGFECDSSFPFIKSTSLVNKEHM